MGYLENMREKPRHVKNRHAFVAALIVTFVVATVWTFSLPARFSENTETAIAVNDNDNESDGLRDIIDSARLQLGGTIHSVKDTPPEPAPAEELTALTEEETATSSEPQASSTRPVEGVREPRVILIGTTSNSGIEENQ